jgi:hypothetical protein
LLWRDLEILSLLRVHFDEADLQVPTQAYLYHQVFRLSF